MIGSTNFWLKSVLLFFLFSILGNAQETLNESYFDALRFKHDVNLPQWGPYTKNYIGLSHIPDTQKGIRFDLSVFPGFYRRKVEVPNVTYESGFHPWEASPNLEYFSFRHELEWKDEVYTDISYSEIDSLSRLIRIECVNNTNVPQSIVLHFMASIHFPSIGPYQPNTPLVQSRVSLPDYAKWTNAIEYSNIEFTETSPQDNLVYDGMFKGEIRGQGLINGSGIGNSFGMYKGDKVDYEIRTDKKIKDAVIWLRYKMEDQQEIHLDLTGLAHRRVRLTGNGTFGSVCIPVGNIKPGKHILSFVSEGGASLLIDGFTVIDKKDRDSIQVDETIWDHVPDMIAGPVKNSLILKYGNLDNYYGIYWDYPNYEVREWYYEELGDDFKMEVNGHTKKKFYDGSDGHYTNIFLRPINVAPNSTKIISGYVYSGSKEDVESLLASKDNKKRELIYEDARKNLFNYKILPSGTDYLFSQQRMAANVFCNVVYPVYTQGQYIRHHTPGRWWDSLYTWDSGFIGIGLSQQDVKRGIESLNAYLNEPEEQSAFIHHGTPLPVQHYLFLELWNQTQSEALLRSYYPKLKRYYEFITGINQGSSSRMPSNLVRTWDYFYNSGGWDDYPPQKYVHENSLEQTVVPVVNTAHSIRIAKILQMAAMHLDLPSDSLLYAQHIKQMSDGLLNHSWDHKSGYFGYVVHDGNKRPTDILKYDDQINYNMGLGGASPLIAGICTENQKESLLEHLKTKGELWSNIGLSAVDQSAPYFSTDGYWNGTIWMPHQWFFWKTMLDLGETDFAYKIAKTALDLWKKEVESTYNCYEHFVIETGRGAGWTQFSGLSSPILSWFNAYYGLGTVTTGFNAWIIEKKINATYDDFEAKIKILDDNKSPFTIIVNLDPNHRYKVFWNDRMVDYKEINKGSLNISINGNGASEGILKIIKKD